MSILVIDALLVGWLDPAAGKLTFGLFWRNWLPLAFCSLLLYGLIGRYLLTIWIVGVSTWLLFTVNAIKLANMNSPLMPGDLVLKYQLLDNAAFFTHYTKGLVWIVLGAVVFLAVTVALWWAGKRLHHPGWILRLAAVLVPLVLMFQMLHADHPWRSVYADASLTGFQQWDPGAAEAKVGVMASLVRMTQDARTRVPKADKTLVAGFARAHSAQLTARAARAVPADLPDIVVVQSEAFFAPSVLKGVEPGEFAPNFTRLSEGGISGSLQTPAYGGGTIRTEFETLTGYPIRAFPKVEYPYYGLASAWMPSVPHRLEHFGYATALFHPFLGEFWNRNEVMPMLGFQRTYFEKSFGNAPRAGKYISDHALFDFVLSHLDEYGNKPFFVMAITMENHGPWNGDPGSLSHLLHGRLLPPSLSAEGTRQMRYYLSHLVNGDAALGDFARRLMARKRWTILVFYGDHLPALDQAFHDLGFDNSQGYGSQKTHYMLLSNRPLTPRKLNIASYELPGLLFDVAGLPEDGYLAFDSVGRYADGHRSIGDPDVGQVLYNAARLEVRCRSKIMLAGACSTSRGGAAHPH
ncbi:MAG TPA: LTA synthase family protein [Rhodanobacteraceae bacterium]|nr:LTA synthase family protein [Rhodanobacteraceae bacterium]